MAEITVDVIGEQLDANTFKVTWTTSTATPPVDMPAEIFVFKFATEKFDHIANGSDLQFPIVKTPSIAFYRQDEGDALYGSIAEAETAKTQVDSDIQLLVDDFNADLVNFLLPSTTTFT